VTAARLQAPALALREARAEDVAVIQRIYAHHVLTGFGSFEEEPPEADEIARRLGDVLRRGLPYLVAEIAAEVTAFAYAAPFRPRSAYRYAVEDSVYVAPASLGRGIGRALLAELIGQCTRLGLRQMIAVIGDSGNHPSIRLHETMGFRRVGLFEAVGRKRGRWLDIVLMQRPLGPGASSPPPSA